MLAGVTPPRANHRRRRGRRGRGAAAPSARRRQRRRCSALTIARDRLADEGETDRGRAGGGGAAARPGSPATSSAEKGSRARRRGRRWSAWRWSAAGWRPRAPARARLGSRRDAALAEAKAAVEDLERELEARTERVAADEAAREPAGAPDPRARGGAGQEHRAGWRPRPPSARRWSGKIAESPDVARRRRRSPLPTAPWPNARHAAEAAEIAARRGRTGARPPARPSARPAMPRRPRRRRWRAEAEAERPAGGPRQAAGRRGRPGRRSWTPSPSPRATRPRSAAALGDRCRGRRPTRPRRSTGAAPGPAAVTARSVGRRGGGPCSDRVDARGAWRGRPVPYRRGRGRGAGEGLAARLAPGSDAGRPGRRGLDAGDGLVKRAGAPRPAAARLQQARQPPCRAEKGEIEASAARSARRNPSEPTVTRPAARGRTSSSDAHVATTAAKEATARRRPGLVGPTGRSGRHAESGTPRRRGRAN